MFLNKPHLSHRHESKLLKDFANIIFQEKQSLLPYFVSALTFYKYEEFFREGFIEKKSFYSFKAHLMMVFRELIAGSCPNINSEKKIDSHCESILNVLKNDDLLKEYIIKSTEIFSACKNVWAQEMGKSYYGMKDISDFTNLLLNRSRISSNKECEIDVDGETRFKGVVQKIIIDRYGNRCGFISRIPDDIFFHSLQNQNLNFVALEGKYVSYAVDINKRNGKPIAVDVKYEEA